MNENQRVVELQDAVNGALREVQAILDGAAPRAHGDNPAISSLQKAESLAGGPFAGSAENEAKWAKMTAVVAKLLPLCMKHQAVRADAELEPEARTVLSEALTIVDGEASSWRIRPRP